MMREIITAQQAVRDNVSPESLLRIADWHRERAQIARASPGNDKLVQRHDAMARALKAVAADVAINNPKGPGR